MIWDFLNAIMAGTAAALQSLWISLPTSPIYLPAGLVTTITPLLHTMAWFWPVQASIDFLLVYFLAVGALVITLAVKQFIEAVIP